MGGSYILGEMNDCMEENCEGCEEEEKEPPSPEECQVRISIKKIEISINSSSNEFSIELFSSGSQKTTESK